MTTKTPKTPRTYYLTVAIGHATIDRFNNTYLPHFNRSRSFGPYTLKGAVRIERQIHATEEPDRTVNNVVHSSGTVVTTFMTQDHTYFAISTKITNNYSPIPPTKGSPLNYV